MLSRQDTSEMNQKLRLDFEEIIQGGVLCNYTQKFGKIKQRIESRISCRILYIKFC